MKDRIKMIMDAEEMTPARFADTLQIGRAVISHILNGRNNPSLDVIMRILNQKPYINSDWLLTGNGNMYRENQKSTQTSQSFNDSQGSQYDLFSQNFIKQDNYTDETENSKDEALNMTQNTLQHPVSEKIVYVEKPDKKISQIIIYYTDNTFERFGQENE